MLTDAQIVAKYGEPGDYDNFTIINLPYPMRIAWDISKNVTRMQCHKLVAQDFTNVFNQLLQAYGISELQRLGIDLFGGCVNIRKMRGSTTKWSRHSWGIAIDLDPARNGLKINWQSSQFSKPEYNEMLDIFYNNGFINYGLDKNYDSMHFEINK